MGDSVDLVGNIASGGLSALGSVASSLISGSQARSNWREMAEYNSPQNQVKRLRKAGLNPSMAMMNGMLDSGNVSSAAETNPTFDLNPLAESVRSAIGFKLQEKKNDAEVDNLTANTQAQLIRNKTQLARDLVELTKQISENKKIGKATEVLEEERKYKQKMVDYYDDVVNGQLRAAKAEAELREEQAETERIMRGLNAQLTSENIRLSKSQQALLAEEAKSVREGVNQMILNGNSHVHDHEQRN